VRIFAIFVLFQVDLCFSKTPLNIQEYLNLTKARMCRPPFAIATLQKSSNIIHVATHGRLTLAQGFSAILLQDRTALLFRPSAATIES
jgi:hypothetical protein